MATRFVAQTFRGAGGSAGTKSIASNNQGGQIEATILYADLSESTNLVDNNSDWLAAEVYKAFLRCSAKIIKSEGGEIRSNDGDRVMGLFHGDSKNTSAARSALKINYAVNYIIQPAFNNVYGHGETAINHTVGIDTSQVLAVQAGVRGENDIAWIGRAANHAAKLTSLPHKYMTYVTADVFNQLRPRRRLDRAMVAAARGNPTAKVEAPSSRHRTAIARRFTCQRFNAALASYAA